MSDELQPIEMWWCVEHGEQARVGDTWCSWFRRDTCRVAQCYVPSEEDVTSSSSAAGAADHASGPAGTGDKAYGTEVPLRHSGARLFYDVVDGEPQYTFRFGADLHDRLLRAAGEDRLAHLGDFLLGAAVAEAELG